MKIMIQNFVFFLPILIMGLSIICNILFIIWKRNHLIHFVLTCTSLIFVLCSFLFNFIFYLNSVTTSMLCFDNFSIFYSILVVICSIISCLYSYDWLIKYSGNKEEFYLLILIATLGGIILPSANHMASFFIGIELISLPLFGLIGYALHYKYALESTIKYSILSCTSSAFTLLGIAFLYISCGSLQFKELHFYINHHNGYDVFLLCGIGLIFVGIGFKLSLAPFHFWTPDIYQGSPLSVVYFLSTVSKISIFSSIIRFFVFIPENKYHIMYNLFSFFSFGSILIGNVMALKQKKLKRLIGYSSIAHFGYLVITLITKKINQTLFLETTFIYLIGYILSNIGIFGIIHIISNSYQEINKDDISSYRGLFWKYPLLSLIFTVMFLSLAGLPLTLGFISKFYLIQISLYSNLWWIITILILGSTIGLYYYLKIIILLYLSPPKKLLKQCVFFNNFCIVNQTIVICSCILILLFGIYPQTLINFIQLIEIKI